MNRPPAQPKRSSFSEETDLAAYDRAVRRYSGDPVPEDYDMGPYFGALLTSPLLCAIASEFGTFVRTAGDREGTYSHRDREFVDQVLCADWKTNIVQRTHIPDAIATGVRIQAIKALRGGAEDELTEDEKLLARYIRQAVSGTVDDETWSAMDQRLGTRGLVEYTGFVLWLQWIIRMMQALGLEDPDDDEIDRMIEGFRSGAVEVPDYRVRIR